MQYIISAILVLLSGLFSGLTLGMFSLGLSTLQRKIKLGDERAIAIYKVRKNGSLLLCTLLLGNVAVNSALSIFLGSITSGIIAGIISTGLIVVLGEIIPQALFSRFALNLGYRTVWIVRIFQTLFFPVAAPLAWMLDKLLGEETPAIWSKRELKEIIKDHEDSPYSNIDEDEERIVLGALTFSEKKAHDIMTPKTVVYYLNSESVYNTSLQKEIKEKGFSRIPVFKDNPDNMIGMIFIKELFGVNADGTKKVKDLISKKRKLISVDADMNLDILFNTLLKERVHMALLYNDFGAFNGIVSLEDIIEEIIKTEIVDEDDKHDDMQKLAIAKFKGRIA